MSIPNTLPFNHMPFPTLTDVLVRDRADVPWERAKFIFRRDPSDASFNNYTYVTDTMQTWAQCIPLAGNEHLENIPYMPGLLMPKYDLIPFQQILTRNCPQSPWRAEHFSHATPEGPEKFCALSGRAFSMCIPYEGNEHLANTLDWPAHS